MQKSWIFLIFIFVFILAEDKTIKPKPNFSLTLLDSAIKELHWCGISSNETLLVLTESASIYKSKDKGFSWKRIDDNFYKLLQDSQSKTEVGEVQSFLFSKVDPQLVIFQGSKGVNWISIDCGETVKAMDNGRPVNEFQLHPLERNWILAAAWTICDDFLDKPCLIYKELFISFDLGENWVLIEDYVVQFSWAAIDKTFKNIPKSRIILAHDPEGKGHQKVSGWNEKVHLSYSDDFFKTFEIIVPYGNKFLLSKNYFFVATVNNEETQDVSLIVANPSEPKYSFNEVKMPMRRLKEHSYTILDTSEGRIFLHINHLGPNAKFGNIYISDSTGTRFSLSLKNNVRDIEGECDFEKISGLDGIFIANTYEESKVEYAKTNENAQINYETDYQRRKREKAKKIYQQLESYKTTVISFDMGGIWTKVPAPSKDSTGKKITCKDDRCSLHLNSFGKMNFGPVYSVETSVGLIMATGNVGYFLETRADKINTYLSRDGGLSWLEVAKGSHIYEFGDHGGIILMASDQEATTNISYSWNEGLTWETLEITKNPFEITNIIIEPTNTGLSFVIYGENCLVGVDFSSLHPRNCQGFDNPDAYDSDYELWSPNDENNPKCLMGKKVTYVRRKKEAECFNTQQFERKTFIENCECTEEDWECDLGFERKGKGPCIEIKTTQANKLNSSEEPIDCVNYYYITQGYRKVAGDACIEGVDHSPIKIPCSRNNKLNSSNIFILLILGCLIGGLLLFGTENKIKKMLVNLILKYKNEKNLESNEKNFGGNMMDDTENEANE